MKYGYVFPPFPPCNSRCASCSVCFPVATIKHSDQNQFGEEMVYLAHSSEAIIKGSQGRNLKAGTGAEIVEDCCLLVDSACCPPAPGWYCSKQAGPSYIS